MIKILSMLTGMFSRTRLYLIAGAASATVVGMLYFYYTDTQSRLADYAANQEILESSLEVQRTTITVLRDDIARINEVIGNLNDDFSRSREQVQELENKFRQSANGDQRDFGALAAEKPGLVQNIVNNGTQDVLRCFELLSGDTATAEERQNEKFIDCFNDDSTDSMQ